VSGNREQFLKFKASAYLQRLIGSELFRSDELAVVELVKNAYDSGAKTVIITISRSTQKRVGYIEIRDNGSGMTVTQFERYFMFAGFSSRPGEVGKSQRIPTGEKGIGRFASDRLGRGLLVTTKTLREPEALVVNIDWTAFENRRKEFNEIQVPYSYQISPDFRQDESGTLLHISHLTEAWDDNAVERLRHSLEDLLDPSGASGEFTIDLQVPGSAKLSGQIETKPITEADIKITFRVGATGSVCTKVRGAKPETLEQVRALQVKTAALDLAEVHGRLQYFIDRPSKHVTHGYPAGVRIYRDGFRLEPFGSQAADWLGIAEKRAKRAGHAHIVPSRLYGYVSVSRVRHPELKDTTSRESLIDTPAARALVDLLRGELDYLEQIIAVESDVPRWEENKARTASERERARLQALHLMSAGLAHELRQPLQTIIAEAHNIKRRLELIGINDNDITEAHDSITAEITRIDDNIQTIASLANGQIGVDSEADAAELVRGLCRLFETRCAAAGIEVSVSAPQSQDGFFDKTMFQMVLLNLLRNAYDVLATVSDGRQRKIQVSLVKRAGKHRLAVTDNGTGIPEEMRPRLFHRVTTGKTGGWGYGLYYSGLLVKSRAGEITFATSDQGTTFTVELPDATK
jgi:hypothetical protein